MCGGNGSCFQDYVCDCGCPEPDCDCDYEECECEFIHINNCLYNTNPEHKNCIIFCKYKPELECGCKLYDCHNNFICQNKMPEYLLNKNGGLCDGCYLQLGLIEKDIVKECFICLESKENIKLVCNHSMCFDCFEKWSFTNEDRPCPMCRNHN